MKLSLADGSASIPLDGSWRFKIEQALDPKVQIPQRPFGVGNPNVPNVLYNAMIAPLVLYGIKGAIWYQGESNADRAMEYRELFPTMIRDWRGALGRGAVPVLLRPARQLHGPQARAERVAVGGASRGPDEDAVPFEYGHGPRDRHR